jgi:hypothetical protein
MFQGAAPGTTYPMPGHNTPVGTPHATAMSPAQDVGHTAGYSRAHFNSVFNKQQDSGGMSYCISLLCLQYFNKTILLILCYSS